MNASKNYLNDNNRQKLLEQLKTSFAGHELNELCFILGINYDDDLSGEIKADKLISLIGTLERRDRLQALIDKCRELRPNKNWEFLLKEDLDNTKVSSTHPESETKSRPSENPTQVSMQSHAITTSPPKQTGQFPEQLAETKFPSISDRSHFPSFIDSIWERVKKWLWVQLLIWTAFSVISFVSDLSGVLDLTTCTRLNITSVLVILGGTVILGISVLPTQRQKHQTWDRGLATFLLIALMIALTWYATYTGCSLAWPGANARVHSQLIRFQNATDNSDKLEALSNLFNMRSLFISESQYDAEAFSLFFSLSAEEQISLFAENQVEDSSLILVISKIAPTLVEGYSSSTSILEAMSARLASMDETEASSLKEELDLWLNGRILAAQQDTQLQVLQAYQKATQINGENPATLFELAKQFYLSGDNDLAFIYFDRTLQSARNHLPLEIAESSPNGAFTSVEMIENTILATFANTPLLNVAYEEQSVANNFPYLENLLESSSNENTLEFEAIATEIVKQEYSLVQITSLLPEDREQSISEVIFSPNGEIVYSAGNKLSVYFWRIDRHEVSSDPSTINSIQYLTLPQLDTSENGFPGIRTWEIIVSGDEEGNLIIFNQSGDSIFSLHTQIRKISEISSPLKGSHIALLGNEGSDIQIWDLARRIQSRSVSINDKQATSIAFKPYSDDMLIVGFSDGFIGVWNRPAIAGNDPLLIDRMSDSISDIAFAKDGSLFATLDSNNNISIWDSSSLNEIAQIENIAGLVTTMDFSIDGKLVVGTKEGSFHLYSSIGEHLLSHQNQPVEISSLIFSPKESVLAVGYMDGRINVYQVIRND